MQVSRSKLEVDATRWWLVLLQCAALHFLLAFASSDDKASWLDSHLALTLQMGGVGQVKVIP